MEAKPQEEEKTQIAKEGAIKLGIKNSKNAEYLMKHIINESKGRFVLSLDAAPDFVWVPPQMDDNPELVTMMENNTD